MISLQLAAELYEAHIVAITKTTQIPPNLQGYASWINKERTDRGGMV